MLLVLCVDLDDDLGRKTGIETPVVGRDAVREAAVELATADPEDSDVNVLFQGVHLHDELRAREESVEVAAVTGVDGSDLKANRAVGAEVDEVLASLSTGEDVRALVVTDGAQDESVLPVVRSRVTIDGVRRVVVRQAQDLESMYYTIKQVLDDPETRGTILIPLGILLLIYPLSVLASQIGLPGAVLGLSSGMFGLYLLARGFGIERTFDDLVASLRRSLYTGRVTLITYVVAGALLVIGGASGVDSLEAARAATPDQLAASEVLAALVRGAVQWFAAAGITTSVGQITDEYLADSFEWRYMNAPFYVLAIAAVLHAVSAFVIDPGRGLPYVAMALTLGTLLGLVSTFAFAVAEERFPVGAEPA
jgi:putative membrane protein